MAGQRLGWLARGKLCMEGTLPAACGASWCAAQPFCAGPLCPLVPLQAACDRHARPGQAAAAVGVSGQGGASWHGAAARAGQPRAAASAAAGRRGAAAATSNGWRWAAAAATSDGWRWAAAAAAACGAAAGSACAGCASCATAGRSGAALGSTSSAGACSDGSSFGSCRCQRTSSSSRPRLLGFHAAGCRHGQDRQRRAAAARPAAAPADTASSAPSAAGCGGSAAAAAAAGAARRSAAGACGRSTRGRCPPGLHRVCRRRGHAGRQSRLAVPLQLGSRCRHERRLCTRRVHLPWRCPT